MINIDYVSLHNHTSFSIMHALTKPLDLFERSKEYGQNSVAVTDLATLAGMWDSLKASKQTGVKLIAGCEFYFVNDVANKEEPLRNIIILAKNATGYKNLLMLSKKGYDNFIVLFKKAVPRIDWNLLKKHSEGLICLTAGGNGLVSQALMAKDFDLAKNYVNKLKEIFEDNFALELQPHAMLRKATAYSGEIDQRFINIQLKKIAEELNVRCVVTTNSHYLEKEHHKHHDVLLAIGSGQPITSGSRLNYNVPDFHIKNAVEIAHYFVRLRGLFDENFTRSLFENTIYFADQCEKPEWIDPKFSNPSGKELPEFPVKNQADYKEFLQWRQDNVQFDNLKEDESYLRYKCEIVFDKKRGQDVQAYRDRLEEELDVLNYCGVASYMLIVADYVEWAKSNGIPVGSGRGSVGGSYVAYLLDIHQADPIKYGLVFPRFHNKLKESYSDIDLDFATSGLDKIKEYIQNKYGDDYVAHVSNINTITPKVYVRDIARTFEFGDSGRTEAAKIGTEIADLISSGPDMPKTMVRALEKIPLLAQYAIQYPQLAEFAPTISGKARAWSTHAAALIIGKRPLANIVPVRRDVHGNASIEYDKDRAEENSLVKMDILGLSTLDIIADTNKLIAQNGKNVPVIDCEGYDKKTYDLISDGNTFCTFQFGTSPSTINLCKQFQPKTLEDLSLITTLARPAAAEIRNEFFEVKEGKKEVELLHEKLSVAFKETFGFPLYDEGLLILGNSIAGWDLNEADRLRKLTKEKGKNPKKVKQWRETFIQDAFDRNSVDKEIAGKIWDEIIEPFQKYSFNKSHALLYSMISYHTAYLKAHFPLEFLVANLMFEVKSNAKIAKSNILKIKEEIRRLGVKIVAPDLNVSETTYKIINDKTLMTGLDSLKFIGKDAIPEILAKRPFTNFEDFLLRTDGKKVRAPAIQALAASGCLDSFKLSRKLMFLYASDFKKKLQLWQKKKPEKRGDFNYPWPEEKEWSIPELCALERFYLGESISGTLNERFEGFFDDGTIDFRILPKMFRYRFRSDDEKENRRFNTFQIPDSDDEIPYLKAVISDVFSFKVKKEDSKIRGQIMARLNVQDLWGNDLTLLAFPDAWKHMQDTVLAFTEGKHKVVEPGIAITFTGAFQYENEHTISFILDDILDVKAAPSLPADRKGKKVKMPRASKKSKEDIEMMDKEELAEEFEEELINDGISSISEDDNEYDPFS